MSHGAICEPIDIDPAVLVDAHLVLQVDAAEAPERFPHFHDAVELVWFRRVRGEVTTEDGVFRLAPGVAMLIPSMRHHDFAIEAGPQGWILAHLDPSLLTLQSASPFHRGAMPCLVARFDGIGRTRMEGLFDWLLERSAQGGEAREAVISLTRLIVLEIWQNATAPDRDAELGEGRLDRLRPALDLVAKDPSAPISLDAAAAACRLSTPYFSRRFKFVFEMNFSDYVRAYRLRLAAQRLLASGARISEIAFDLGFVSPAHFTAVFQKRFGSTPRDYRARRRTPAPSLSGPQA